MPAGRYRLIPGMLKPLDRERGIADNYEGGAHIFLKKNSADVPVAVANEYCGGELARQLRLPVPPGFVADVPEDGETAYATLGFNLHGENTPEIDAAAAVRAEPDLCSGVLVFDVWIINTDRHPKNLSFLERRPPHRVNVFDHSHAPFYPDAISAMQQRMGIAGWVEQGEQRGHRHCLLDVLPTDAFLMKWVERIQSIPEAHIREICTDAEPLGWPAGTAATVANQLIGRRAQLPWLISRERHEFKSINQWGLEWAAFTT
jgi:hypothetical protein